MTDECASAFGRILRQMVERIPGAIGAIFTDWEGEAVDQFARVPVFDIQVTGAHWALVFNLTEEHCRSGALGSVEELLVESERALVLVRAVTERYCVVLTATHDTHLATARRELLASTEVLRSEI